MTELALGAYPHFYLPQRRVFNKHVADKADGAHKETDLTVQSAVAEVVYDKAEGRDIEALTAVELYGHGVLGAEAYVRGQIDFKSGVAAVVVCDLLTVAVHDCGMSRTVKAKRQELIRPVVGYEKALLIAADRLIVLAVNVVVRQLLDGMRKPNLFRCIKAALVIEGEQPIVVKRDIHSAHSK